MMIRSAVSLASALLLSISLVHAQQVKVEGLPVALGDSIKQVQTAFATQLEPEHYDSPLAKDGYTLRLRTKGVWTFFDKSGKARTIRLDAPFEGSVGGVKLGDSAATLKKQLGEPVRKPYKAGPFDSYLYYPDDTYSIRVLVNESGEVETIFITK